MRPRIRWAWLLAFALPCVGCGDDNPVSPDDGVPTGGLQFDDFQAASIVIGQADMQSGARNAGGGVGPVGLAGPSGAGSGALFLPDTDNNRVLGFTGIPTSNGAAASFVLGQPDLATASSGTTSSSFRGLQNCVVSQGKLAVSDYSNGRVLIWSSVPTAGAPADLVVGKPDFTSSGETTTRSGLSFPWHVSMAGGKLAVSDCVDNRVLIWNTIPTVNGAPANVVLGQPDFTSKAPGLSASGMEHPSGIWTDGNRLIVGDLGNRRILIWSSMPTMNGQPADVVVGAPDFVTKGSSLPLATSVLDPVGLTSDGVSLFVADQGLNRVLIFSPIPTENGAAATRVLGQASFTTAAGNDSDQNGVADGSPTARTLFSPRDVSVLENRLLVADQNNHRVLIFESR